MIDYVQKIAKLLNNAKPEKQKLLSFELVKDLGMLNADILSLVLSKLNASRISREEFLRGYCDIIIDDTLNKLSDIELGKLEKQLSGGKNNG